MLLNGQLEQSRAVAVNRHSILVFTIINELLIFPATAPDSERIEEYVTPPASALILLRRAKTE